MAVWPFSRRPRRHSSVVVPEEKTVTPEVVRQSVNQSATALPSRRMSKSSSIQLPWRRASLAKSAEGKGLQTNTLEPIIPISPLDSEFDARPHTPDSQASAEHITALPQSRILKTSPHLRPAFRDNADIPYDFRLQSSSSRLGTPTVPSHFHGSRKLSRSSVSKFGFSNRDSMPPKDVGEEELRAMSTPAVASRAPTRGDSGILRRESKTVRNGLTLNLQRPESRISLPRPDTGIGSIVGQPDARSYRISIMDIMSPRPVMKSTEPYSMLTLGVTDSRAPSRRLMTANTSELGKRSRRVNDLADNLDSTGLRAAMERENRRKEKKKQADAERLKRRLERRAQEQRDDDSEPPLPSPARSHAALAEAADAAVASQRRRSRRRRKSQSRRRSSSASRPDTSRRRKHEEKIPDVPVLTKPEADEAKVSSPNQPQWPKRSDSRQPPVSTPPELDGDKPPKFNLIPSGKLKDDRPNTPLSKRLNAEDAILTPDRIVPEEDPDDAEPPSIARHRHPKHEIPHVAHLYTQPPSPSTHPTRSLEPLNLELENVSSDNVSVEVGSPAEPVLDVMAVEPPAIFAPAETDDAQNEALPIEDQDFSRVSPLLPNDSEDIPGLPFLSSRDSESESQIVSPFAASFPTSFPETDFAAPAPVVHRDPQMMREARYSSLSPTSAEHPFGSSSSITALPQVPTKPEAEKEKPKRKRGPSMILSFFRRGDKRHSRGRSSSEAAADNKPNPAAFTGVQHELIAKRFEDSEHDQFSHSPRPMSPPKPSLGTLVRSQSRFKEDFSGLNIRKANRTRPLSPPESRINSPYNQISPNSADYMRGALITPTSHPRFSTQSTNPIPQSEERRRSKSLNRMSNPLSKSMASIDSEGSWLTGKPVRGSSTRSNQLRNLASDLHRAPSDAYSRRNGYQGAYSSTSEENIEKIGALDHFGLQPGRTLNSRQGLEPEFDDINDENLVRNPSHMASSEIMVRSDSPAGPEDVRRSMRLSTDISAKIPEIRPGIRVKSSEGVLKNLLPHTSVVDNHELDDKHASLSEDTSEDSSSHEKHEKEEVGVFRATGTEATTPRVVSIGTAAKLVELSTSDQSRNNHHNITQ